MIKLKISFISNYLTHHQIPFSNCMYKLLGDDFHFISTSKMEDERIAGGWDIDSKYDYEIKSYVDDISNQQAKKIILESEVVIIGSASKEISDFVYKNCKLVFIYSERILKNGRLHFLSPRAIRNMSMLKKKINNQKTYLLCASAYTAGDYLLFNLFRKKSFKWGYFPETIRYNTAELLKKKKSEKLKILWCGRLIDWKHCDDAIKAVSILKKQYSNFELRIIGDGPEKEKLENLIRECGLADNVIIKGTVQYNYVRKYMEESNVFLFTSDFNEGWGAVVNEAMNSGCAVIASHAAGSVPYLIENGVNGYIYKSGDVHELHLKLEYLMNNRKLAEKAGLNAYDTIVNKWNANVAAERFLQLAIAADKDRYVDIFDSDICSRAGFISDNWYKGE